MANEKHPGGRPTDYKEEYNDIAYKLCKNHPVTDMQLAELLNVTEKTINTWKQKHPEFLQSIKEGKAFRDQIVERSLYERAVGYSHPEEKIFNNQGEIIAYETTKHYPPDTGAAAFWLKNRQPERWREKIEVKTTGNIQITWDDPAIPVTPIEDKAKDQLPEGTKDAQSSDK